MLNVLDVTRVRPQDCGCWLMWVEGFEQKGRLVFNCDHRTDRGEPSRELDSSSSASRIVEPS